MKDLKRILLLSLLGLAVGLPASAQTSHSGIKGGVNFSNLFTDDVSDEDVRVGFHAGVFAQLLNYEETFGFQPELLYSAKGARTTYNLAGIDGEIKFNLDYIDLPLLLVFKLGETIDINVGGYAAYLANVSLSSEGDLGSTYDELDREHFKPFDYGLVGGVGFNFSTLGVGVRYNYGLQEIADSDAADFFLGNSKNAVGQVYLSVGW